MTLLAVNSHMTVIVGSDRTVPIRHAVNALIDSGGRTMVTTADSIDGQFDPARDDILSPFDPRGQNWDLFGEVEDLSDVYQLVEVLTADVARLIDHPEWLRFAYTFLVDVIARMWKCSVRGGGNWTNQTCSGAELSALVTGESTEALGRLLGGSTSFTLFAPENAGTLAAIRSIVASALGPVLYSDRVGVPSISVRRWVRDATVGRGQGDGNVLFIPFKSRHAAAARAIVPVWIGLAVYEAVAQESALQQGLNFVIDGLDSFGQISNLRELVELRGTPGRIVLGMRSLKTFKELYGTEARAILKDIDIL